jgi:hypothetical protein
MIKTSDIVAGGFGSAKALASRVPILNEILAGFDSYKRARFEPETEEFLQHLYTALDRVEQKFEPSWFTTHEGDIFARKVLDCAVDAQLADKKELFANALVSGALDGRTSDIEKLKFVDFLRHLSRAAIMVLADIHSMLSAEARGPGRNPRIDKSYPLVDPKRIAEHLSSKYNAYLVEAALQEMQSYGLFSSTGEWIRQPDGTSRPGGGFDHALAYTDFTCRFVEFITLGGLQNKA